MKISKNKNHFIIARELWFKYYNKTNPTQPQFKMDGLHVLRFCGTRQYIDTCPDDRFDCPTRFQSQENKTITAVIRT